MLESQVTEFSFNKSKSGFDCDEKRASGKNEIDFRCFLIECLDDVTGNVTALREDDKSFKFK